MKRDVMLQFPADACLRTPAGCRPGKTLTVTRLWHHRMTQSDSGSLLTTMSCRKRRIRDYEIVANITDENVGRWAAILLFNCIDIIKQFLIQVVFSTSCYLTLFNLTWWRVMTLIEMPAAWMMCNATITGWWAMPPCNDWMMCNATSLETGCAMPPTWMMCNATSLDVVQCHHADWMMCNATMQTGWCAMLPDWMMCNATSLDDVQVWMMC